MASQRKEKFNSNLRFRVLRIPDEEDLERLSELRNPVETFTGRSSSSLNRNLLFSKLFQNRGSYISNRHLGTHFGRFSESCF